MPTDIIDNNYVSIRVSKKVGKLAIQQLTDYAHYLETTKDAPQKVSKKIITEIADDITASAWQKLKQKRGFKW
ncbi:MAG: hypothetical protein KA319_07765 [Ferruginibacter sp.]|nr:hypothetical protein [Ferruginibacter sp.]